MKHCVGDIYDGPYSRLPLLYNNGLFFCFFLHLYFISWLCRIHPYLSQSWSLSQCVATFGRKGVLIIWQWRFDQVLSTEFYFIAKNVFSVLLRGTLICKIIHKILSLVCQLLFLFSFTLFRESHWYSGVAQSPRPCALQANTVQNSEPGFDVSPIGPGVD